MNINEIRNNFTMSLNQNPFEKHKHKCICILYIYNV